MILVNGASGIGTGYSTNVLQFNPLEIVDRLKKLINGGDYIELTPYYRGFNGKIKKVSDQHYIVEGVYKIINDDTVHITEIPISLRSISFEKYKEFLLSIMILDKKEDNSKKKVIDFIMKPYNNKVDITVQLKPGELQKLIKTNELEKYLKLTSKLSMTNMYLYNANGKITKYDSPYEILEDFYNIRYQKYIQRKEYQIIVLENNANIAKYKRMFIEYILDKKIIIEKQKKDTIIARLKEFKFPRLAKRINVSDEEKSYQYLIDMQLWSLTFEKIEELKKEEADIQCILEDYKNLTIAELWIRELDEFIKVYGVFIKDLEDIRLKEEKLCNKKESVPKKKIKKTTNSK